MLQRSCSALLTTVLALLLAPASTLPAGNLPQTLNFTDATTFSIDIDLSMQVLDGDGNQQVSAEMFYKCELELQPPALVNGSPSVLATLRNVITSSSTGSAEYGDSNHASHNMSALDAAELQFDLDAHGACTALRMLDPELQATLDGKTGQKNPEKAQLRATLGALSAALQDYLFFGFPEESVAPGDSWQTTIHDSVDAGMMNVVLDYQKHFEYLDQSTDEASGSIVINYASKDASVALGDGMLANMFKESEPTKVKIDNAGTYALDPKSGLVRTFEGGEHLRFMVSRDKGEGKTQVMDLNVKRSVNIDRY